jgi:hypothetical protein
MGNAALLWGEGCLREQLYLRGGLREGETQRFKGASEAAMQPFIYPRPLWPHPGGCYSWAKWHLQIPGVPLCLGPHAAARDLLQVHTPAVCTARAAREADVVHVRPPLAIPSIPLLPCRCSLVTHCAGTPLHSNRHLDKVNPTCYLQVYLQIRRDHCSPRDHVGIVTLLALKLRLNPA